MNCRQVLEQLSAFNDKELETDQTTALKAHLIRCPSCRQKRDELEEMGRRIRHLTPLTTPEDFQFRVYSAIRRYQSKKTFHGLRQWQTILMPAAAMVLGIVIGLTTDMMMKPLGSQPVLTASDQPGLSSVPVTAVADEGIIRDYPLDRYVQGSMVPVDVITIPDTNADHQDLAPTPAREADSRTHSSSHYVLDNIPLLVNYERTIY